MFRIKSGQNALATAVVLGALISGLNALAPKVTAQSPLTLVIVELKRDSVVVAKAKAEAGGGQSLRMPFYYRAVRPSITPAAPTLAPVNGTEVNGSPVIDINGAYSLSYSFTNSPAQISVIGGL